MTDLDEWRVTLTTGEVLVLRAHSVHEADECLVFLALMKGSPNYEYEVARVPLPWSRTGRAARRSTGPEFRNDP